MSDYFLTTARLGFRCWAPGDLPLARTLWGDPQVTKLMDYAAILCHLGCAMQFWLVVAGGERSHLWLDDRASDGGISPVKQGEARRVTFGAWYQA